MSNRDITLLVFSCEGREHLLVDTIKSFKLACGRTFKTILAIDGPFSHEVIAAIQPDLLVQNITRKGYIHNIINALSLVKTPFLFWLEDDWKFPNNFSNDNLVDKLSRDEKALQVVLSKEKRTPEMGEVAEDEMYQSPFGFSANPCLCKTTLLQEAFKEMLNLEKDEQTKLMGFENYLTQFMKRNSYYSLLLLKNDEEFVVHSGFLESTAREYHMVNSLDEAKSSINKEYISGLGSANKVTFANKIAMLPKLWVSAVSLSLNIFKTRQAYDYAFRIYSSYTKKFKH